MNTGIILQARTGSSRLPSKVVMPFYQGKAIIGVLIDRLKDNGRDNPVVLATSTAPGDELLCKLAGKMGIDCYRGPEQDVLGRFIMAAEKYGFSRIVRICADNPFLDVEGTMDLLDRDEDPPYDYIAYRTVGDIPSIRSHLGLWGEVVQLDALKRVRALTGESLYHEHVTNYIYGYPDEFRIRWVEAPISVYGRKDIRLTIDDETDFNMAKELIGEMGSGILANGPEKIAAFLDEHPHYLSVMRRQIEKYAK